MERKPTILDYVFGFIYTVAVTAGSAWAFLAVWDWFEHKDDEPDDQEEKKPMKLFGRSYTTVQAGDKYI